MLKKEHISILLLLWDIFCFTLVNAHLNFLSFLFLFYNIGNPGVVRILKLAEQKLWHFKVESRIYKFENKSKTSTITNYIIHWFHLLHCHAQTAIDETTLHRLTKKWRTRYPAWSSSLIFLWREQSFGVKLNINSKIILSNVRSRVFITLLRLSSC